MDGVRLMNDVVWTLCLAFTVLWLLISFGGLDQLKVKLGQCKVVVEKKNVAVQVSVQVAATTTQTDEKGSESRQSKANEEQPRSSGQGQAPPSKAQARGQSAMAGSWRETTSTTSGTTSSRASASGSSTRFSLPPTPAQINYLKMLGDRLGRALPDN
eukprot:13904215-Alexandrium_andersonii.AAC.1